MYHHCDHLMTDVLEINTLTIDIHQSHELCIKALHWCSQKLNTSWTAWVAKLIIRRPVAVPTDLYRISFHSCQTRNPTWHHGQTPGQSKIIGNSEEEKKGGGGAIVVKIFKTSAKRSSLGLSTNVSTSVVWSTAKNALKEIFFIAFIFSLYFGCSCSVVTVLGEWSVASHTSPF